MSHQRVLKALTNLGLTPIDAEVYIFLANNGPQKTEKISQELKFSEQQLFGSLENLTNKGVVSSTREHSALFYALPFEKALNLLVKEHLKRAQVVEQKKDDILTEWKKIVKDSTK